MSIYSFYIAHLVCCGEGGMVSTNNRDIAKILSSTRSHGRPFNSIYFDHQRSGLNSKMNDMEASLGLEAIDCFWQTFYNRHAFMKQIRRACMGFEDMSHGFQKRIMATLTVLMGLVLLVKKMEI